MFITFDWTIKLLLFEFLLCPDPLSRENSNVLESVLSQIKIEWGCWLKSASYSASVQRLSIKCFSTEAVQQTKITNWNFTSIAWVKKELYNISLVQHVLIFNSSRRTSEEAVMVWKWLQHKLQIYANDCRWHRSSKDITERCRKLLNLVGPVL